MNAFQIQVPATSANLGPGFDSIGIALSLYVTLHCEPAEEWFFSVPEQDRAHIPSGKNNLIYKSALYTANAYDYDSLPAYHVRAVNDVPVSRGLGSSSTAVVGGIELANQILDLQLSDYEKVRLACAIEGHPDNVAPAICGGIMISSYDRNELDYVRLTDGLENLTWLAIVPGYHLETEKARQLLPGSIDYKDGVHSSAKANVLVAALAAKDWKLAGKMMTRDQWHQPYRKQLISEFDLVQESVKEDALGLYISGAGPTMIALYDGFDLQQKANLQSLFPDCSILPLKADVDGITVELKECSKRTPLES
ncbi:homoserine kinase [Halobacillus yeomjeoni]|uniref:Homoserine kinase n=1 Tax=Halobacillus yeomjeoni TaxID=311194 RepID=A0A931MVR7_9BACI|nr:homoserine kinase [Halobacillus yeomjeoni]MBH0230684.1 homoserine kinase [Halobacillus yeomjeoni]